MDLATEDRLYFAATEIIRRISKIKEIYKMKMMLERDILNTRLDRNINKTRLTSIKLKQHAATIMTK